MNRTVILIAIFIVVGSIAGALSFFAMEKAQMPRVHKLEQPLLLSGGDEGQSTASILPKGTSLYFDQAFPEGFVRYKVYINVEGVNLDTTEVKDEFWIEPLTAFPIDKDQLRVLLRTHPLSKNDLSAILKSAQLSKNEIREILSEYSE